ncbi:4'-phosphopantetheinyl transferase family protein [Winogradskyella tangerina]|uniref:4'-phosphopantetheinyl transferase family protein n=1 Tax=Winogradskyella tangerina TaxID=2023240 RepID=UPI000DBE802A|nr:4'-phosphopantetheinyl transferase superfamily protein [Winogradskyella tangerina]
MVGNDIVDIALAQQQSNWKRPRYLDKIFTQKEQDLILQSDLPEIKLWQLWSMKEAAYKLYTQINPCRFFNPKAFECTFSNGAEVTYDTFTCAVKTETTSNYIMSEARLKQDEMLSSVIEFEASSVSTQSEFLKDCLLSEVAHYFQTDRKQLNFVKQAYGIPTIEYNDKMINVSLAHHGQYGTIAFSR